MILSELQALVFYSQAIHFRAMPLAVKVVEIAEKEQRNLKINANEI